MSATRRPNVVVVLTDDHAAHAISAYGSVVNRTPRIDEVGARGVRFERCFAANSLCAPSRASILTGTHSHVNGVTTLATPIDAAQPTFVSQLRAAGYRTALFGKWHLGEGPGHDPAGFDEWQVFLDQGEYVDPQLLSADGLRGVEGYATTIITDLALAWLDTLPGDEPWCLLVWHKAPHRPWIPDPARDRTPRAGSVPVPATFDDDLATRTSSARRAAMRIAEHLTSEDLKTDPPAGLAYDDLARWKYQRFMDDYLACVDSVDDSVGRLVDALEERRELDDTLFLYASDQGFFLGDHGWFDKRFMYEESLRMPLLLAYPRRLAGGQVFDGIVTNVDWARTVLDACGAAPHPRMQGRSCWPDLVGAPTLPPVTGMYYRYWEHDDVFHRAPAHYGYRTERHKLIYFYNDGLGLPGTGPAVHPGEWELYDLLEDPQELRNVADHPAYAAVRAELERGLAAEQARVGDVPHPSQALR